MFVTMSRVAVNLCWSRWNRLNVLNGVLRHVVLGGTKSHDGALAGSWHWRLTLLDVWVLELLRCSHTHTQNFDNHPRTSHLHISLPCEPDRYLTL